jgi:hypothetical protein
MRDRLLHPTFEALQDCAADLRLAAEYVRRLDAESAVWKGVQRTALEAEVTALRLSVSSVEALLTNAGKFYAGLARLLAPDPAPPNYTSAGSAGPPPAQTSQLVIHG